MWTFKGVKKNLVQRNKKIVLDSLHYGIGRAIGQFFFYGIWGNRFFFFKELAEHCALTSRSNSSSRAFSSVSWAMYCCSSFIRTWRSSYSSCDIWLRLVVVVIWLSSSACELRAGNGKHLLIIVARDLAGVVRSRQNHKKKKLSR